VCALHCAQLLRTILHRTDLIIFPLTLQTIATDWNRPHRRPHQTWVRAGDFNIAPRNTGLAMSYCQTQTRQAWSAVVGTATSAEQATQ